MPTSSGPPLHRYVTSLGTGHRDEGAESGPQHVFTQHRVRVQPQLGSAEEAEAQVEHLQRQAVTQRLFVLAHEAAALEDGEQAVHRRRGLAEHPRQVGDARTALQRTRAPRRCRAPFQATYACRIVGRMAAAMAQVRVP